MKSRDEIEKEIDRLNERIKAYENKLFKAGLLENPTPAHSEVIEGLFRKLDDLFTQRDALLWVLKETIN